MISKTIFLYLNIVLVFVSCMSGPGKDKFGWAAAVSAPANYKVISPQVFFYSQGELVLNAGAPLYSPNWGHPDEAHRAETAIPLPDSVFVSYEGLNDKNEMWRYEGGAAIPQKMLSDLFNNGYKEHGQSVHPAYITAGMAPCGRVCIWANPVEIMRFTIPAISKVADKPLYGEDDKESLEYLVHHPVNTIFWEKPEKRYILDFGFCTRNADTEFFHTACYSKEGLMYVPSQNTETIPWGIPYGTADRDMKEGYIQYGDSIDYRLPLPVHMVLSWKNKTTNVFYCTDVVMPKDLQQRFERPYTHTQSGKQAHFNRIVLGVEKDGEHAILWFDGPGRQEKIITFRGLLERQDGDQTVESGGYAKDVVYY